MISVTHDVFGGAGASEAGSAASESRLVVTGKPWGKASRESLYLFLTSHRLQEGHEDLLKGAAQEWLRRYPSKRDAKEGGCRGWFWSSLGKAFRVAQGICAQREGRQGK